MKALAESLLGRCHHRLAEVLLALASSCVVTKSQPMTLAKTSVPCASVSSHHIETSNRSQSHGSFTSLTAQCSEKTWVHAFLASLGLLLLLLEEGTPCYLA